jgi:hypothetical protein
MFKFVLFIMLFAGNTERKQVDTIIRWSEGYRLNYTDFVGNHFAVKDSIVSPDTLAVINCSIKYEIKLADGRRMLHSYAAMDPQKSWMLVKTPGVLKHEQGHFDITEIYARKFEKMVNDTSISDVHDYFIFLADSFKKIMSDLNEEDDKYDSWTKNTPGKDYYYKWINEQLFPPK